MPQTTDEESLRVRVRQFTRQIQERLTALDAQYSRELKKAGFDRLQIGTLTRISQIAAARSSVHKAAFAEFWRGVDPAGRELSKMNVPPARITAALQICDDLIDRAQGWEEFSQLRKELRFTTILSINQAYHGVREEENRTFCTMLDIEAESSNTDVLLRRLLESVAETSGADAAHAYLLSAAADYWEIRASSAKAASRETLAMVPAAPASKRMLAKPRRVTNQALILDAGWRKRYKLVFSIPIRHIGVLQLAFRQDRELLPRELEMLSVAGERCYAATRRTRLVEDIAEREDRLSKLAIRMLMVEENERRRISRELHDDAGQSLVVIRLQMELIEQLLPMNSEERERLAEARDITEKTILDIRRLISDLSPAVLDQLGLGAALRQLTNRFRNRYPCHITLEVGQLPQLDSNFELVIYRLAQECLNNICQHSASTRVNISVSVVDRVLRLRVEDNGIGFDVKQALERSGAFGLIGIRERVAVLGGRVEFISTRKEGQSTRNRKKSGTVVRIELPIS